MSLIWEQALEIVVARTGHGRYRELCADSHPRHEDYRRLVIAKAPGESVAAPAPPVMPPTAMRSPPPRPEIAEGLRLIRLSRSCPYQSRDLGCGCSGVRCSLRPPGRQVGPIQDCVACLKTYPM